MERRILDATVVLHDTLGHPCIVFILDDPDRFRSRLDDLPFLMWVSECLSHGPPRLQKRLIALIDPDSVQRLATGKFSREAAVIIGRLPGETVVRLAEWILASWRELPRATACSTLLGLSEVLPEQAERLAIEHLEATGFAISRDPLAGACVRALERGSSPEGLAAARRLIDQALDASSCRLRRDLLRLCLRRRVPGGRRAFLNALDQCPAGRARQLILNTLTDDQPGQLDLSFALQDLRDGPGKAAWPRLAPLMLDQAKLDEVARILRGSSRPMSARILGWAAEVFDATTRPLVLSLLEEFDPRRDLPIDLAIAVLSESLAPLTDPSPRVQDLSLKELLRLIALPVDLGDMARALANRLSDFPRDQVLRSLRGLIKQSDAGDPVVRFNALSILGCLAWPESLELLVSQLDGDDDDPAVEMAVDALTALGAQGTERLVSQFATMSRRVQLRIPRILERSGGASALGLAREVMAGPDVELAERFTGLLTCWPDESMLDLLAARTSGESELLDSTLVKLDAVLETRHPRAAALRATVEDRERDEDASERCPHCHHPIAPGDPPDLDHDLADESEDEESAGNEDRTEGMAEGPPAGSPASDPTSTTGSRQDQPKVGRNEPCPCGSGKKFKRCCLV